MKLFREGAQLRLNAREVGAEFVSAVARVEPAFEMRPMPLGRHRPQIYVEHLGRPSGEGDAARILLHRRAGLGEDLPQTLERPRLDTVLIRLRLRGDARPQFAQKIVRRRLVGREILRRCDLIHSLAPLAVCSVDAIPSAACLLPGDVRTSMSWRLRRARILCNFWADLEAPVEAA